MLNGGRIDRQTFGLHTEFQVFKTRDLGIKYDRAGGVWDNFFGVGIGVQLPVFNRNKAYQ